MKLRTAAAIAVGVALLMAMSADAHERPGISAPEARVLRHEVEKYQMLWRLAAADGRISRAEAWRLAELRADIRRLARRARWS